jgi:hypothetical protein
MLQSNLATGLGLANGTRGTLVGLQWDDPDLHGYYHNLLETAAAGEVHVIPHAPTHVIVRVGERLIPLDQTHRDSYKLGSAEVTFKRFPYDVLFAATYCKVQALTLDKVIVDVSRPYEKSPNCVTFPELYVALSRARTMEGVRIFLWRRMADNVLKRNPEVQAWISKQCESSGREPPPAPDAPPHMLRGRVGRGGAGSRGRGFADRGGREAASRGRAAYNSVAPSGRGRARAARGGIG